MRFTFWMRELIDSAPALVARRTMEGARSVFGRDKQIVDSAVLSAAEKRTVPLVV